MALEMEEMSRKRLRAALHESVMTEPSTPRTDSVTLRTDLSYSSPSCG